MYTDFSIKSPILYNIECVILIKVILLEEKSLCFLYIDIGTWKDLSTPNTLSVKVFGTTDTGDFSFSHKLPGDQISWLRFLMHKFNGESDTSSEIVAVGFTKGLLLLIVLQWHIL